MNVFCEHQAFFDEAISFYRSAQVVKESDFRIMDEETELFSPIIYLFRHATELLFKALLIRHFTEVGVTDWQSVKLKSSGRKLSATHSLLELYIAWKDCDGEELVTAADAIMLEDYVEQINRYDKDSTFFRYPIDKEGNRNKRAMTEELDEELLMTLPCSLGAIVHAKGPENFSCLHREQLMEELEFVAESLVQLLIRVFDN